MADVSEQRLEEKTWICLPRNYRVENQKSIYLHYTE